MPSSKAAATISKRRCARRLRAQNRKPPEHIQIAPALPRDTTGAVRREILQLIAMNQVDLIEPLLHAPAERELVATICAERKNLRDRFSF